MKQDKNTMIEGWTPSPLEQMLMDGTFKPLINEDNEDMLPEDMLDVLDFRTAMDELIHEFDTWQQ